MANQNTIQDDNLAYALIAHSGTADTATTIRVVANSSGQIGVFGTVATGAGGVGTNIVHQGSAAQTAGTANYWPVRIFNSDGVAYNQSGGNLLVNVQNFAVGQYGSGGIASNITSALTFSENFVYESISGSWNQWPGDGTNGAFVNVKSHPNIPGGTIGSILGIGGTVVVSGASAGTNINVVTGSQQTLGTVGTVPGIGTVTNLGSLTNAGTIKEITNIAGGTITTTLAMNTGTITTIVAGTQNTLGTVGTVPGVGIVTALAAGTVGGKAASGVAAVANPVQIAGTDSGGTIYSPLVTSTGQLTGTTTGVGVVSNLTNGSVNILTGSLQSSGTTTGVGVVTSITNLVSGTLLSAGTVTGVGVVSNLTNGSVNILTGSLQSAGTVTGVGVVSNLTNGSVNILTGSLIGTFQQNLTPIIQPLQYGTLGTAGGSAFGTISAASGAGTKHYVSGVSMIVSSGTVDCYIGFGTVLNGGSVLARGNFVNSAGMTREFNPIMVSGTNSEICYELAGAGTVYFMVNYWKI